jgi:hypothetical protein
MTQRSASPSGTVSALSIVLALLSPGFKAAMVGAAPSSTPTPAPPSTCIGDCNSDGRVMVSELITAVNIALGGLPPSDCPAFDCPAEPASCTPGIAALLQGVNNALHGCAAGTPTPVAEDPALGRYEASGQVVVPGHLEAALFAGTLEVAPPQGLGFPNTIFRYAVENAHWRSPHFDIVQTNDAATILANTFDHRRVSMTITVRMNGEVVQLSGTGNYAVDANGSLILFTVDLAGAGYTMRLTAFPSERRDAPNQPPFALSSLSETCDDQTAAALVSSLQPEYHFTLRPRTETQLPPQIPLTIRIAYRAGALTCYPAIVPPEGSTRPQVAAQVGVVMDMQFLAEGGAFAEHFATELKGRAGGSVTFSYATSPDNLRGTYRPDLPGYEDVLVGFFGSFDGDLTNGAVVQSGIPPGHVSELIPVAQWATYLDRAVRSPDAAAVF